MPRPVVLLALAALFTLHAGCGGDSPEEAAPTPAPTEAEARIAEANARAAEAEARLAEAQASGEPSAGEARAPEADTPTAPASTPPPPASEPFTANVNLDGPWMLCTTYDRSAVARYRGMELCYDLTLTQTDERITASGRKRSETVGGQTEPLSGARATPITVRGTINNDLRMRLAFTEQGANRNTEGTLTLSVNDGAGGYAGSFTTDAANSSGSARLINMR